MNEQFVKDSRLFGKTYEKMINTTYKIKTTENKMKSIDDLMEQYAHAFLQVKTHTGCKFIMLAYAMMLRGEM